MAAHCRSISWLFRSNCDHRQNGNADPAQQFTDDGRSGAIRSHRYGRVFTVIKIREGITSYEDPGWYRNPEWAVASVAPTHEMHREGIDVGAQPSPDQQLHHQQGQMAD